MSTKRDKILRRLQRIAETKGMSPDAVLEDAKNKLSPLHACFEWDDTKCGHLYRLDQARRLIASVKVEIRTESRSIQVVRYIRDPSVAGNEQGYVETASLRTERDRAREALNRELMQCEALMERTSSIAAALDLESEFDDLLDRLRELRTKVNLFKAA